MGQTEGERQFEVDYLAEQEAKRLKRQRARLIRFLVNGGVLLREDHGGCVGVIYHAASRNVRAFETAQVEALFDGGFTFKHTAYKMADGPGDGLFRAK